MKRRLAIGLLTFVAFGAAAAVLLAPPRAPAITAPETVWIAAGEQDYRPAGEFRQGARIVDAPVRREMVAALEIMKFLVSEADYARCASARWAISG